jgi:hypothetical protein
MRVDLMPAVPALVSLLNPVRRSRLGTTATEAQKKAAKDRQFAEKRLNSDVCWVLRELAEKKKTAPQVIMDALDQVEARRRAKLLQDENVQRLVEICHAPKNPGRVR